MDKSQGYYLGQSSLRIEIDFGFWQLLKVILGHTFFSHLTCLILRYVFQSVVSYECVWPGASQGIGHEIMVYPTIGVAVDPGNTV